MAEKIHVPATSPAPTVKLCWKRPDLDDFEKTGVNPMAPPCDRRTGHLGPCLWALVPKSKLDEAEALYEANHG